LSFLKLKKMIVIRCLIILTIIITSHFVQGQLVINPALQNPLEQCNTILTQEHREYLANTREERESLNFDNYRPPAEGIHVMVHIVVQDKNDLSDEFTEAEVDTAIERLNEYFVQAGLHFRRCLPINYVSEDQDYPQTLTRDIYPNTNATEAGLIMNDHAVPNAVNVIFTPIANGYCGYANYPSVTTRLLVMKNSCADGDEPVFAHEMGHYFNLQHTFDGPPENVARPGDPSNGCPPGVDCSNCGPGIGDELCDTPANPQGIGLGTYFTNSDGEIEENKYSLHNCTVLPMCTVKHGANIYGVAGACDVWDSNGDLYSANPRNIMSYGEYDCRDYFSPQQIDRMRATLFMGNADLIADEADFNSCSGCATNSYFFDVYDVNTVAEYEVSNSITSWAVLSPDVLNPDGTLVEAGSNVTYDAGGYVCLNPGFNAEYTSNFLAIIDGCGGEYRLEKSGLEVVQTNNFKVYPNPVSAQAVISYELNSDSKVSFSLFDTTGKQITTLLQNEQKAAGLHQFNFNVSNLPTGIYYCIMQANEHIETQKVIITK